MQRGARGMENVGFDSAVYNGELTRVVIDDCNQCRHGCQAVQGNTGVILLRDKDARFFVATFRIRRLIGIRIRFGRVAMASVIMANGDGFLPNMLMVRATT